MELEKKIEWLKPERIRKLDGEHKDIFGINRLLIIGVGRNGADCVLRCKHLTEKRFGTDGKKVRYLAIAEEKLLSGLSCEGTVPAGDESLPIEPEESIYKYLNNPARLPQYALGWFDSGLKNYSPAIPTYGLSKRQCGRVALFHNIKPLMKRLGESVSAFAGSDKSLEIVITGNIGDSFFGGMFIDLAYIAADLFAGASYPVRINCVAFAPDTAEFIEKEPRDLGNYYANALVTKEELDKFQVHKKPFSQRYSSSFEVVSDKPPFTACFLVPAERNYAYTLSCAAEKILSRMEMLFSKDDNAEHIMSYNMLKRNESHEFRYLSYGVSVKEIPLGKIMSYLSVRVFTVLNHQLNKNSVGELQLGQISSRVTPNSLFLASKSGQLPKLEFDERLNPKFSPKALKVSSDGSMDYVEEWVGKMTDAAAKGADVYFDETVDSIISMCETAKTDMSKGPFYAIEIIKKCLADLRVAIAKTKSEKEDMSEQVERSRALVNGAYMKIKTSALFVSKAVEQYTAELKEFAEYNRVLKCADTLAAFYKRVYDKLEEYLRDTLSKAAEPFETIAMNRASIIEEISRESENSCVRDVFSVSAPAVSEKLDKLVELVPESRLSKAFKSSGILELPDEDETALAKAIISIVEYCFGDLLSMSFGDLCEYFEAGSTVATALSDCIDSVSASAPVSDDFALNRVICPNKAIKNDDVAALMSARKGMNYIWNGSVLNLTAVVTQIKGGVKLNGFKDYEQWENMRYAYVNDSLKKHGIHIFK